jgi:hypothetical protein
MNLLTYVYGRGNAKAKRARRGMEKDWNRYDEPLKKLMGTGDSMKKSPRWIKRKKILEKEVDNE